jgi:DNA-binding NarL/FixJ family response regulator
MRDFLRNSDPPRVPLAPDVTLRRLSAREQEIALLIADGLTGRDIARKLDRSFSTIRLHIRRIQQRLELANREQIAAWVIARRSTALPEARLRRGEDDPST